MTQAHQRDAFFLSLGASPPFGWRQFEYDSLARLLLAEQRHVWGVRDQERPFFNPGRLVLPSKILSAARPANQALWIIELLFLKTCAFPRAKAIFFQSLRLPLFFRLRCAQSSPSATGHRFITRLGSSSGRCLPCLSHSPSNCFFFFPASCLAGTALPTVVKAPFHLVEVAALHVNRTFLVRPPFPFFSTPHRTLSCLLAPPVLTPRSPIDVHLERGA